MAWQQLSGSEGALVILRRCVYRCGAQIPGRIGRNPWGLGGRLGLTIRFIPRSRLHCRVRLNFLSAVPQLLPMRDATSHLISTPREGKHQS